MLGCIADDFTGATDLAGMLRRSGVEVSLRTGVPSIAPDNAHLKPVEIIALKCRTVPVADAIAEVELAFDWLQLAGASKFFWKYCSTFDSTAEGNIGPVAEALMAKVGSEQTIYCPAFPQNGRSIYMGNLFVGEQPLHESPMKDHPLTPMRDSNLVRLLQPQTSRPVGLVNRLIVEQGAEALRDRLADLHEEGVAHVVTDAVSNGDLEVIAEACRDMTLLTGGSAVAAPLPALYGLVDHVQDEDSQMIPALGGGKIVLCGSCSAMTRAQVATYQKKAASYQLDPFDLAKNGTDAALEWLKSHEPAADKLVYATADPEQVARVQSELGSERAGELVEHALGELAVAARDAGIVQIVAAGGETSGAVTKALGVEQMIIGPEIAPGVPWTWCDSEGTQIGLALKSGNFGAETFFSDAFELLERQ